MQIVTYNLRYRPDPGTHWAVMSFLTLKEANDAYDEALDDDQECVLSRTLETVIQTTLSSGHFASWAGVPNHPEAE